MNTNIDEQIAEADEAYSLEQAANDLIEAPASSVPATYDPGEMEEGTSGASQEIEEAAALLDDDAPSGRAVAHHNGHPLTLSQLAQGFSEGAQLLEVLRDVHSRYRWIQQAGENVYVGAQAIVDLLTAIFPPPNAALANTDPVAYLQAQALYEEVENAAVQVVEYAQGVAQQQVEWANAQIQRDNLWVEQACFLEAYPQATNPEWLKQFGARITNAAESCGYHATELNALTDHRALKVLDLAAKALEKQQGGSTRREEAKQPRPASKPRLVASGGSLSMSEALLVDFE